MTSFRLRLFLVLALLPLAAAGQTLEPRPAASATVVIRPAPIFFKRAELTDAQVALIEEEREINNLNVILDRPASGEEIILASIKSIDCVDGRIHFKLAVNERALTLTTQRFDDIRFAVLTAGTRAFTFRCDGRSLNEKVVAVYRPAAKRPDTDGVLTSLTIVPENFRLKTLSQIATEPLIIIEGMPPTLTVGNEAIALQERAEMQRIMREAEERDRLERHETPATGRDKPN